MKRFLVLLVVLCLTLTGCLGDGTIDPPETVADGTPWDDSWTSIGGRFGVAQPPEDFRLLDTNGDLPDMEMYYASWVWGQVTRLDEETTAYDGQLYLLAEECGDSATAADTMLLWREQLGEDFAITQERTVTAQGVEFTLVFYDCLAEDAHFATGITAMGVWKDMGILVDTARVEGLALDLEQTLLDFLNGFHYAV